MKIIPDFIKKRNRDWKVKLISPYLRGDEKVLDFGCGDMGMSEGLRDKYTKLKSTGVDVIDIEKVPKGLKFIKYDGKKLPFKNGSFDAIIAFYVLHHCNSPDKALKECSRVGKKIILVESVPEYWFEIPFMRFFDFFYNIIKLDNTPLPYNFRRKEQWEKLVNENGFKVERRETPKDLSTYLPFGKLCIIVAHKD